MALAITAACVARRVCTIWAEGWPIAGSTTVAAPTAHELVTYPALAYAIESVVVTTHLALDDALTEAITAQVAELACNSVLACHAVVTPRGAAAYAKGG